MRYLSARALFARVPVNEVADYEKHLKPGVNVHLSEYFKCIINCKSADHSVSCAVFQMRFGHRNAL